jgi:heat shock protein HslJ
MSERDSEVMEETTEESNQGSTRTTVLTVVIAIVGVLAIVGIILGLTAGARADAPGIDQQLIGRIWYWTEASGPDGQISVDDPSRYSMEFTSDGTVHIQADCNQASSTYTASEGKLSIGLMAMTMAMCEPGSLSDALVAALGDAETYRVGGGALTIDTGAGESTLTFSDSPPAQEGVQVDPGLLGRVWRWYEFVSPVDTIVVDAPNLYTVEFKDDGTIQVVADCNRGSGSYSASDGSISFGPMAMTMAVCGPDSLSDEFVRALSAAAVYGLDGDTLLLDLPYDSGTLKLAEDPPRATPEVDPELIGKIWRWYAFVSPVDTIVVDAPNLYTVEFKDDGTVQVVADCNRGSSSYSARNGSISFGPMAMTMAVCGPDSFSDGFVRALGAAAVYGLDGDTLLLDLPADSGTLKLAEDPPQPEEPELDPELMGKAWQWYEFVSPVDTVVVEDPERYTVEFASDGTVHIRADCNRVNGKYTAGASRIDIEAMAMTRAMCPPGSLSNDFVKVLNDAVVYSFEGDTLLLDLPMDSGTLKLAEDPPVLPPPEPTPTPEPDVDPALLGTVWQWYQFVSPEQEVMVDNPPTYTVEFMADGRVNVRADCNRGTGRYTAREGRIEIQDMAMTLAACLPGSLGDAFVEGLTTATIYSFGDDSLLLDLPMDVGTMMLAEDPPVPPGVDPELAGKAWRWTTLQDPTGTTPIDQPDHYQVWFGRDRSVRVRADCNSATGSYTIRGGNLSIQTGPTTLAACPPGSLGTQFLANLDAAGSYTIQGKTLRINLMANGGTMTFDLGQ